MEPDSNLNLSVKKTYVIMNSKCYIRLSKIRYYYSIRIQIKSNLSAKNPYVIMNSKGHTRQKIRGRFAIIDKHPLTYPLAG